MTPTLPPLIDLDAQSLASVIAHRPRGGARRDPAAVTRSTTLVLHPTASRGARARRARRGKDALFIDAFDAASFISARCAWWDVAQVMAHHGLAKMAVTEAEDGIRERMRSLPKRGLRYRRKRAAQRALLEERAELHRCASVLLDIHEQGALAHLM